MPHMVATRPISRCSSNSMPLTMARPAMGKHSRLLRGPALLLLRHLHRHLQSLLLVMVLRHHLRLLHHLLTTARYVHLISASRSRLTFN